MDNVRFHTGIGVHFRNCTRQCTNKFSSVESAFSASLIQERGLGRNDTHRPPHQLNSTQLKHAVRTSLSPFHACQRVLFGGGVLFCGMLGSPFLLGLWFEVASSTACGRRCAPGGPFARARLALKQDILTVLRLSSSSYWQNKYMLNVLFVLISERMVPDPYCFPFLRVLLFRRQAFVER